MSRTKLPDLGGLSTGGRLAFLGRDTLLYGTAGALNKSLALITFPILARHFTPGDYGIIDLCSVVVALLTSLLILGQDSAIVRFFHEYADERERAEAIGESLVFQFATGLLLLVPLWLFASAAARALGITANGELLLRLVLLQVPCRVIVSNVQALLKITFSRTRYLLLSIGSTVCTAGGLLIAVLAFDTDIAGVLIVYLGVFAVFACIAGWAAHDMVRMPNRFRELKRLLPYAVPMGLIVSLAAFQPYLERWVAVQGVGVDGMGIYSAGARIALVIALPIQAFQTAWIPFAMTVYTRPDAVRTFNWLLKAFTLGLCITALLVSALAVPLIAILAGEAYVAAGSVVFPLVMGLALQAVALLSGLGTILARRTHVRLFTFTVSVLVSGSTMILLSGPLGLTGVAGGALMGHAVKAALESWFGQRLYPLDWNYRGVTATLAFTVIAGLAAYLVPAGAVRSLYYGACIPVIVICGWAWLFDGTDRGRMMGAVRSGLRRTRDRARR